MRQLALYDKCMKILQWQSPETTGKLKLNLYYYSKIRIMTVIIAILQFLLQPSFYCWVLTCSDSFLKYMTTPSLTSIQPFLLFMKQKNWQERAFRQKLFPVGIQARLSSKLPVRKAAKLRWLEERGWCLSRKKQIIASLENGNLSCAGHQNKTLHIWFVPWRDKVR